MVDEIYDRSYQAGRAELNDGLDALVRRIRNALTPVMDTLYRIEWDAPWASRRDPKTKA